MQNIVKKKSLYKFKKRDFFVVIQIKKCYNRTKTKKNLDLDLNYN